MKIPNILTIVRFLLIPIIAFLLYSKKPGYLLISIIFFLFAALSDWADGFIARAYNQKSEFGILFDPLVDKMLILTIFFIFVDLDLIPLWMVLLILFRELLVTGIRQVFSTHNNVIGANWMGKTKFLLQTFAIIYIQLFLYFRLSNKGIVIFNETIIYYIVLIVTIASLAFALNFLFWYRKKVFSKI